MTLSQIRQIIDQITFKDRVFTLQPIHGGSNDYHEMSDGGCLLQMHYKEQDVTKDEACVVNQSTRKWYIEPDATESSIVQTALLCVLTSQEHIAREHFMYKGVNLFGPHQDINGLRFVAQSNAHCE